MILQLPSLSQGLPQAAHASYSRSRHSIVRGAAKPLPASAAAVFCTCVSRGLQVTISRSALIAYVQAPRPQCMHIYMLIIQMSKQMHCNEVFQTSKAGVQQVL